MQFPSEPTQALQNFNRIQQLLDQEDFHQIQVEYEQGNFTDAELADVLGSDGSEAALELLAELDIQPMIPFTTDPTAVLNYLRTLPVDPTWPERYGMDFREPVRKFLQEMFPGIELPEPVSTEVPEPQEDLPQEYFEVRKMLESYSLESLTKEFSKFKLVHWYAGISTLDLEEYARVIGWALQMDINPMQIIPTPVHADKVLEWAQENDHFESLAVIFGNAWSPVGKLENDPTSCPPEWVPVFEKWGKWLKTNDLWEEFFEDDPELLDYLNQL